MLALMPMRSVVEPVPPVASDPACVRMLTSLPTMFNDALARITALEVNAISVVVLIVFEPIVSVPLSGMVTAPALSIRILSVSVFAPSAAVEKTNRPGVSLDATAPSR